MWSKEDIDYWIDVLAQVCREAHEDPELVRSAPHNQVVHKLADASRSTTPTSGRPPGVRTGGRARVARGGARGRMTDLAGRTVLVTGASKGIGAETAAALGRAGAHVVAHYNTDRGGRRGRDRRDPGRAQAARAAQTSSSLRARRELWDERGVLAADRRARQQRGGDASGRRSTRREASGTRGWERAFRINVLAAADLTRAAVLALRRARRRRDRHDLLVGGAARAAATPTSSRTPPRRPPGRR